MASAWVDTRTIKVGANRVNRPGKPYRVLFRIGGRDSKVQHAGSFRTKREANLRRDFIAGELAAGRTPNLSLERVDVVTIRTLAERWQASRVDVAAGTLQTYKVALGRILPR